MPSGAISNFSCAMLVDHQDHNDFPILYDYKGYDALDIFLGQFEIMSPIPVLSSLLETTPTNMSSGAISNFSCVILVDHQDDDDFSILYYYKDNDALGQY